MVTPPFNLVPRSVLWPGELPTSSNGVLRPLVQRPALYITGHYTGSPGDWDDFYDTSAEARAIQVYAQHAKKPWEYNWIIDSEGNVVEYAGMYQAAHSAGENGIAHGVLLLLGIGEPVTPAMVLSFRQLRWWLQQEEATSFATLVRKHKDMPGAATACPGPEVEPHWVELTSPWFPPPPAPKEKSMFVVKDSRPPHAVYLSDGVVKTWVNSGLAVPYAEFRADLVVTTSNNEEIASYGPIVGPHPGAPFDAFGRIV
jgi:hypothetical protein